MANCNKNILKNFKIFQQEHTKRKTLLFHRFLDEYTQFLSISYLGNQFFKKSADKKPKEKGREKIQTM